MYYYVYEWYVIETGEIIYVGKGSKNRYKVRKHNKIFNETITKYECASRIIQEFETEEAAFEFERVHIDELWAKGQCKCNLHKGGYGGTTEWWTPELRKSYSDNNVMKREDQKKRMSENNPMKCPEVQNKVKSSTARGVIIGDKEYFSLIEASKVLKVSTSTIQKWCKNGINTHGELCRYKDSPQVIPKEDCYLSSSCKGLTYKGKHYKSATELIKELQIGASVIFRWLKIGFDPYGNPCRYDNDDRQLVFNPPKFSHRPVIVNGVHYKSPIEAANALGVTPETIRLNLRHKVKSKTLICEYDNQQPSQENTDISILEGSETNG